MVQCHPCKEAALVWGPPDQEAALVQGTLLVRRMHWIRLRAFFLHEENHIRNDWRSVECFSIIVDISWHGFSRVSHAARDLWHLHHR